MAKDDSDTTQDTPSVDAGQDGANPASAETAPLMPASSPRGERAHDAAAPLPEIDGYEILEELPAGGQGRLFKARELTPAGRVVVLKFPRGGALSSQRAVALFENEVRKAAGLSHPNIARVYSSGLHRDLPFYSMEYVSGVDLAAFAERAHLGQRQVLRLIRAVCLGVQHAHQRGVIHRDLKPANVLHQGIRAVHHRCGQPGASRRQARSGVWRDPVRHQSRATHRGGRPPQSAGRQRALTPAAQLGEGG